MPSNTLTDPLLPIHLFETSTAWNRTKNRKINCWGLTGDAHWCFGCTELLSQDPFIRDQDVFWSGSDRNSSVCSFFLHLHCKDLVSCRRGFVLHDLFPFQECPPTPKERPRSTPNILESSFNNNNGPEAATGPGRGAAPLHHDSSVATSSSEITLMEENISAYCEPFGTAVLPQVVAQPRRNLLFSFWSTL